MVTTVPTIRSETNKSEARRTPVKQRAVRISAQPRRDQKRRCPKPARNCSGFPPKSRMRMRLVHHAATNRTPTRSSIVILSASFIYASPSAACGPKAAK